MVQATNYDIHSTEDNKTKRGNYTDQDQFPQSDKPTSRNVRLRVLGFNQSPRK